MIRWLKELLRIVREHRAELGALDANRVALECEIGRLRIRVGELEKALRERTEMHADVGFSRDGSYAVLIGRYHAADYVQVFALDSGDFAGVVQQMRHLSRYARLGHIDAPPTFKAIVQREMK